MASRGILAYGAYLPFQRLDRKSIAASLGAGGGKGTRTVASYDEDTTSLGVEAARRALRALPAGAPRPTALYFATSDPGTVGTPCARYFSDASKIDSSSPSGRCRVTPPSVPGASLFFSRTLANVPRIITSWLPRREP